MMANVSASAVRVEWDWCRTINYAMQQNHVPVVRRLWLTNAGERELREVQVSLRTEPIFAFPWSVRLDALPPGQPVDVGAVALQLAPQFLAELTERMAGTLELVVEQDGQVLARIVEPIDVLAFDEWNGLAVLPELAAAFAMPNHPEVTRLVKAGAVLLGEWSGRTAFDAYQSKDPNRVRLQAAALYGAIQQEGLTYCVAPASFEPIGQRVRLPDAVMTSRLGNCLDLSLLYAACLEAVGLHPLLVFTHGHAFVGLWLIEETFPECVQDDASLLTKRLADGIHELALVEATALTAERTVRFEEAEGLAAEKLADPGPERFDLFVDIRRARASGVRPLPLRVATPSGWLLEQPEPAAHKPATDAPAEVEVLARPQEVASIALPKQKEWERRLLDLTLRNTLLNFRLTRSSVHLLTSDLGLLEDALSEGDELQLLPQPQDWSDPLRDAELYRRIQHDDPLAGLLKLEFASKRLRADLPERDLSERLLHLYRASRVSLEENGANTLFLALGLLKWYETPASQLARYAPLVLVPVELVRKTSRAAFIIRMRDEEPQFNVTLLELLKQDFGLEIGGLDPLPKDERGIDLKRIFTVIRHVVMTRSRWDVLEAGYLGLFSFSQFVMWNDLRARSADLARSPLVASLMAGSLQGTPDARFPAGERLDADYAPGHGAVPISADSSQLSAIYAAVEGRSFVLHGPPGTGKSQTITNMIAAALHQGKTVLFVAEKMAALTVVQQRLERIGLGPYCLELHSNKSKKRAVLDQLRAALEAAHTAAPAEWERLAERLAGARKRLNRHVAALHQPGPCGLSVYEAIARYDRVRWAPDAVVFEAAEVRELTEERRLHREELARELLAAAEEAGHPHGHPWADARCSEYAPTLKSEAARLLAAYQEKLGQCESALSTAVEAIGLPFARFRSGVESSSVAEELAAGANKVTSPLTAGKSRLVIERLAHVLELLSELPEEAAPSLLRCDDLEQAVYRIADAVVHGQRRDERKRELLAAYRPELLALSGADLLAQWQQAELQWFWPRLTAQSRIYRRVRRLALEPGSLAKEQLEGVFMKLVELERETEAVRAAESAVAPLLGAALWNGGEGRWAAVEATCDWAKRLDAALLQLLGHGGEARQLRVQLADLLAAGRDAFQERFGPALRSALAAVQTYNGLERELFALLRIDEARLAEETSEPSWFALLRSRVAGWQGALDRLRDWCIWRRVRGEAMEAGLQPLIAALEQGRLMLAEAAPAFERGLYRALAELGIAESEPLRAFSGRLFEEAIAQFAEWTDRFEQLTQQEIAARLAARVPNATQEAAQSSELGILQRAIRSGGRSLSLRKLFEQTPNLLQRISPCMLMSPISVAQYLDPANPPFDLVVFDEASQMPTCEAVGAMARGRHVVVVGDPNQLPPTSFFSANGPADQADEEAAREDLESVLDDCLALGMPESHLLWHYRSRHESLIAFSNAQYYENKLLTFPSPGERSSNVTLRAIDGVYDRGRTKLNRAEAEAVIAEIVRRLDDPELARRSIGVVTFSSVQQHLIEDLLDEAFRARPDLEVLAQADGEPIFVKNLENVQGDERDVILFSIGYGPDASGKVSLNFGPLNRDGGWRRLNVAVSRAREEMIVFSTLRADQLDVTRTSARGVADLRAFLEYAERGKQALAIQRSALTATAAAPAAGIERQIADALRARGHQVELHVGVSGYRLDLGIVDPADPSRYVLGVLGDGQSYSQANTARDRELLRARVLRQLGWTLYRVWTLNWWENPERELERLEQAIAGARSAALRESLQGANPLANTAAQLEDLMREDTQPAMPNPPAPPRDPDVSGPSTAEEPEHTLEAPVPNPRPIDAAHTVVTDYEPHRLEPAESASSEDLHLAERTRQICEQIAEVIEHEGPISRALLTKRVLQAWGVARTGARIERRFDELLSKVGPVTTEHDGVRFYWPKELTPDRYDRFRTASAFSEERRSAEDLPPEEVAAAVKHVLAIQISLPVDDLVREVGKTLGYARMSAALEKAVRSGLAIAIERGYARRDEASDRIVAG